MINFVRGLCVIVILGALSVGFLWQPSAGFLWDTTQNATNRSDTFWLLCLAATGVALTILFWYGWAKLKPNASQAARTRHNVQRVGTLMMVGFILLSLQLLRVQFVAADQIEQPYYNPQTGDVVQDPRSDPYTEQRGEILDTFGNVVVGSQVGNNGVVKRTYANPYVDQLVGYYSPDMYGVTGLEKTYDDYLTGKNGGNPLVKMQHDLLHEPTPGNNLVLTVDPNLQKVAQNALGSYTGAIVLLDANSGAVLAMVGNPHYDPSQLALDPTLTGAAYQQQIQQIQNYWSQLNKDQNSPLLFRPTQGVFTPGSIFKTITLATALDTHTTTLNSTWTDTGSFTIDFHRINDPNRPDTAVTTWTSEQGYMFSLNSVYAQMGLKVGADNYKAYAPKFGFGQVIPFDLPVVPSTLYNPNTPDFLNSQTALADTGFGQGEIQVTPLEMALVAAAMGRGDGAMPQPYLVKEIRSPATPQNPQGTVIKTATPSIWQTPVSQATAQQVHQAMQAGATDGWIGRYGGGLKNTGATVGGKTGTAELGGGLINGWYIAWATKNGHTFAIACLIDHLNNPPKEGGLDYAMPAANQVLTAALATVK